MTDISSVPSLKQSTNANQPKKTRLSNRLHHPVSLSLFHWPKHTSTIVMVVLFFFSYSTQRQFYSVYFLSRFCCLFRHTLSDIFYLISLSLSLSLTFFLKHTCTYYYNVLVASIDYNNNCIYIYKPFSFTSTHTHTHARTVRLVHLKYIDREFIIDICRSRRDIISPRETIGARHRSRKTDSRLGNALSHIHFAHISRKLP